MSRKWERAARRAGGTLALLGLIAIVAPAEALILCGNRSGAVFARETCRDGETRLDPVALGLVGPQGPPGPQGPAGPPGSDVQIGIGQKTHPGTDREFVDFQQTVVASVTLNVGGTADETRRVKVDTTFRVRLSGDNQVSGFRVCLLDYWLESGRYFPPDGVFIGQRSLESTVIIQLPDPWASEHTALTDVFTFSGDQTVTINLVARMRDGFLCTAPIIFNLFSIGFNAVDGPPGN